MIRSAVYVPLYEAPYTGSVRLSSDGPIEAEADLLGFAESLLAWACIRPTQAAKLAPVRATLSADFPPNLLEGRSAGLARLVLEALRCERETGLLKLLRARTIWATGAIARMKGQFWLRRVNYILHKVSIWAEMPGPSILIAPRGNHDNLRDIFRRRTGKSPAWGDCKLSALVARDGVLRSGAASIVSRRPNLIVWVSPGELDTLVNALCHPNREGRKGRSLVAAAAIVTVVGAFWVTPQSTFMTQRTEASKGLIAAKDLGYQNLKTRLRNLDQDWVLSLVRHQVKTKTIAQFRAANRDLSLERVHIEFSVKHTDAASRQLLEVRQLVSDASMLHWPIYGQSVVDQETLRQALRVDGEAVEIRRMTISPSGPMVRLLPIPLTATTTAPIRKIQYSDNYPSTMRPPPKIDGFPLPEALYFDHQISLFTVRLDFDYGVQRVVAFECNLESGEVLNLGPVPQVPLRPGEVAAFRWEQARPNKRSLFVLIYIPRPIPLAENTDTLIHGRASPESPPYPP